MSVVSIAAEQFRLTRRTQLKTTGIFAGRDEKSNALATSFVGRDLRKRRARPTNRRADRFAALSIRSPFDFAEFSRRKLCCSSLGNGPALRKKNFFSSIRRSFGVFTQNQNFFRHGQRVFDVSLLKKRNELQIETNGVLPETKRKRDDRECRFSPSIDCFVRHRDERAPPASTSPCGKNRRSYRRVARDRNIPTLNRVELARATAKRRKTDRSAVSNEISN